MGRLEGRQLRGGEASSLLLMESERDMPFRTICPEAYHVYRGNSNNLSLIQYWIRNLESEASLCVPLVT
jgi:hypothetical protein